MFIRKELLAFTIGCCVVWAAGCQEACRPQETLQKITFPNKWLGDIDKLEINEPSGICWHSGRRTLFLVGDEGYICEIKADGSPINDKIIREGADFEGVTFDPATGLLYVAVEENEQVLEVNPDTFDILREFEVPREFEGRTLLAAGGEGMEGITFVPDTEHPEGGFFYVANQSYSLSNEHDISAVFSLDLPLRSGTAKPRLTGYFEPGIIDLAGLHYDHETGHILAVCDSPNILLEYSKQHELLNVYAFPGDNQEGVTVDPDGYIYIAQDSGGIIKLKWLRQGARP